MSKTTKRRPDLAPVPLWAAAKTCREQAARYREIYDRLEEVLTR